MPTSTRMHRTLLALFLLLAVPFAARAQDGAATPATPAAPAAPARSWSQQDIDVLVAPLIGDGWMMGLVVGVIDGERTEVFAYGQRSADDPRPPDADSIFEIGSVTKVFTGLLLADAVRRGELSLDMPVAALLPDEAVVAPRADELAITLLDLSTHTSGLPRLPPNMDPADWQDPYQDYTEARMYRALAAMSLTHKERTPYAYSNLGVGLLGHVLGLAAGKNYESLLQRRIAKPLHLGVTRIQLDDERHMRFVQGHDADLTAVPPWNLGALQGAGALRSSAHDMLAFGRVFLERTTEDDGGGDPELLGLEQSAAMTLVPRRSTDSDGYMVGLGWHIDMDEGVWLHTGQTGGYAASLSVIPERGQVVVLLTNTATGLVAGLAQRVRDLIAGRPVQLMPLPPVHPVGDAELAAYPGLYRGFGVSVEITRDARGLLAHFNEPLPLRIHPVEPDVFLYRTVAAQLSFERDESGQVAYVVLQQNGIDTRMVKVEDGKDG